MNRKTYGHKSQESAFNGVLMYIYRNYPQLSTEKDPFKCWNIINGIMIQFLKEIEVKFKEDNTVKGRKYNANMVQNNWKEWKEFLKNYCCE